MHVYLGTHPWRALAVANFFLSNKQADDYFEVLGYQVHKEEFCHRSCVFFHRNRCTLGMACAQAVAMRGAPTTARRNVHVPRGAVGGGRGAQQGLGNLLRMATGLLTTFDGLIATNSPR